MMEQPWYGYWRADRTPSKTLPLSVRSVGRAAYPAGWRHGNGTIGWINLYWLIEGNFEVLTDGNILSLAGSGLMFSPPGSVIAGVPVSTAGAYRWLTLDGLLASEIVAGFGFEWNQAYAAGACPTVLFDRLEVLVRQADPAAQLEAGLIAYEILSQGSSFFKSSGVNNLAERCRAVIDRQFADAGLNVDQLALRLNVHRSRLSRLFHDRYGLSPSVYLQRVRLSHAVWLLKNRRLSVAETARLAGFDDPGYFSRLFARELGVPPGRFRNSL